MTQNIVTPSIVAKEALVQLSNNLVAAPLVHREYSSEFVSGVGATINVRKPAVFDAKDFTSEIENQDIIEGTVPVTLDKHKDVSFSITSKEAALSITDFSERIIQPAVSALAQAIDADVCAAARDIPYVSGTITNASNAIADITGARKVLAENKVPLSQRRMLINPTVENSYLQLATFHEAQKVGDAGTALREASLGRKFGFDIYMNQNVLDHTKGTLDPGSGQTIQVNANIAAGGTSAVFKTSDGTLTGTLKKGDLITFAGSTVAHVITEDATAADNLITAKFYPAVAAQTNANTVVTLTANHSKNVAFHRNAFALVSAPLAMPIDGSKGMVVNWNGLAIRVVYGYNMTTKKDMVSLDVLYGVKTLFPELACLVGRV